MINLIKKDFIVSIKAEGKSNIKYILLFLFGYFFMNSLSYYAMPVFISYLVLANTFYYDYKNNNMNFINSMPTKKEDIVYSKYILALIIIISNTIVFSIVNNLLSKIYYREAVLNDVYYAISLFLIIASVVIPLYFKFGYHKIRIVAGFISIILFIFNFSLLQNIADREYYVRHPELSHSVAMYGPFRKFFEYIAMEMDVKYINIQNITILACILFIISMIISLKILKCKSVNLKIISIILTTIIIVVFGSKLIFKDLIHEEESIGFLHGREMDRIEVNLDKVYETKTGTKVKVKFKNNTKYTYRIDRIENPKIRFYQEIDGDVMPSQLNIECEYPFDENDENYKIYIDGVEPFSEEYIVFTIPKGINLNPKYFKLEETVIHYNGQYTAKVPFLDGGYVTINSGNSCSVHLGNIFNSNTNY